MREGPNKNAHCGDCKWHAWAKFNFVSHACSWFARFKDEEGGRFITLGGTSPKTPDWCPCVEVSP